MHDTKVMSHYEFQKKVALAWINQKKSWPQLKKNIVVNHNNIDAMLEFAANTTTASSEQSISISSLGSPEMPPIIQCMKAPPFNEKTLHPKKGILNMRLDSSVHHWPLENEKLEGNCQLHRWATGKKKKGGLLRCSHCNVTLCVKCFVKFHTIPDLVENKEFLNIELGGVTDAEKHKNCFVKRKRNEQGIFLPSKK